MSQNNTDWILFYTATFYKIYTSPDKKYQKIVNNDGSVFVKKWNSVSDDLSG